MAGPKLVQGAPALLFDRLTEGEPEEAASRRLMDVAALKASLAVELDRLLNTRAPVSIETLETRARSTIDYGIPDLSFFTPGDHDGEIRLATMLARTIAAYEPRLADPAVRVERLAAQRGQLVVHVAGHLIFGTVMEAVSFSIPLDGGSHDGE